ncbi:RNA polymerase sigma factor RpoH [Anaerolineae bacterium]|nr:sigma-70 family RNA polymerase sigma factor [Sandaracinaceae bacterium]CAG0995255.1 RNA polymerase sigma factor RpoH [Anaerolineae bacterium]
MTPERDQALTRYMDRVRSIPTLSREEEHELALRVRAGDRGAAERLVEANMRFAVAVALQYRRYGIRLGDLIAEGNLGLMMAVQKFDPDRGTRFVTYAGYWIRAYVLDLVVRSTTMVGAGSGPLRSKIFFRLRRERAKVANLTSDPRERLELLAQRFDVTPEKMEDLLRRLDARDVSLSAPLFDDSGATLQDALPELSLDQESALVEAERRTRLEGTLEDALGELDSRERYIVEQRFMGDGEVSLAALGRKLGVSRERARQLEARAKKKLRKRLSHLEADAA